MKFIPLFFLLLFAASCGDRKSENQSSPQMEKFLVPSACAVSSEAPIIKVPKILIDKILVDFQGRTFNRNAFWNILSRETRLDANLFLNEELKVPEKILFQGFVLFMENYFDHPGENYLLRTSTHVVRFEAENSEGTEIKTDCGNKNDELEKIDISRLISASSEEMILNCSVNSLVYNHTFILSFYQNHLVMNVRNEKFLFSGAEVIRKDENSGMQITALDPQGRTLTMRLEGDKVAIHFFGKTTYFDGTGTCTIQRK